MHIPLHPSIGSRSRFMVNIAKYDKANPGMSTRQVAEKLGDVSHMAVNRARQTSGATSVTPEDDRPTIDKPPRGELSDDQGSCDANAARRRGSLHIGKQQVNARKAPVKVWQLSSSAAAGDGLIGFRLIDGA
jgi:hypothetical protein